MDTASGEEVPVAPPQLEGEAAAAMRPALSSGYSKQFQKSLPPRFLRQQVRVPAADLTVDQRCNVVGHSWQVLGTKWVSFGAAPKGTK